jgi:triosephosphate isomerase
MRKPIIAGNWKLNKTIKESVDMVNELKGLVSDAKNREVVVAPVFTSLESVAKAIKGSNIKLSSQDLFWEEKGAFTGEISPAMLVDAGCEYAIIGHSERRQYFGEKDDTVNKKIFAALKVSLTPIVCIGESLAQREKGQTFTVIEKQLREGLKNVTKEQMVKIVLAYEPIWAIGTGKTATPQQAEDVHVFIRKTLAAMFGTDISDQVRILYGGSVKPENISDLMSQPNVDGGLVGGASMKADSFAKIVKY